MRKWIPKGEAVDECIREGILKEFLTQNRAEVIAMSIFEYDEEKEKELLRKAEFENGRQQVDIYHLLLLWF